MPSLSQVMEGLTSITRKATMATIKEIKAALTELTDLADPRWVDFEADSRSGVQTAILQRKKAIEAEEAENHRLETMLRYEKGSL